LHYVGGVEPLSADYFAAFAERIGRLLNADDAEPRFVGIMSNGTSGDINNINFAGPAPAGRKPYEQIRVVANSVAKAAFEAFQTIQHRDWAPLKMVETEIELGVRLPKDEEVKDAKAILEQAKKPVLTTTREVYARETVLLAKYPPTVKVKLQATRI